MSQDARGTLGVPVSASAESPTGDFEFLADPLALLTDEQERDLREDLAELTRLRRPVEWTARCPHGRDMDWTAVQEDTRAVITCHCMCPEEAA